jgi:hypothetical protein
MAKTPVLHFSHHACTVPNPYAGGDVNRRLDAYFGGHSQINAANRPNHFWRCRALNGNTQHTSVRENVTCKSCIRDLALRNGRRYPVVADSLATMQCWAACCRFHGAPSPGQGGARAAKKVISMLEKREREQTAKTLAVAGVFYGLTSPHRFRETMLETIEKQIPAEYHEALRPAFDEWTMAADLADEMARMLDRAQTTIDQVRKQIVGAA